LGLLALVTPSSVRAVPTGNVGSPALKSLGEQTVKILSSASRVQTFRVSGADHPHRHSKTPPPAAIDHILISRVGKEQGPAFALRLRDILMDARLYPDTRDRCLFEPGAAFRLWSGPQSLDVVLCFHCDDALIVTHDAQGKEVHRLFTNFAPLRPQLLALAREAFPGDPQIASLTAPAR